MDKIEKIRQEIKRRHDYENEMYHKKKPDGRPNDGWAESLAIMGVLEELLTFLDTLSEEPDKSLDEAAEKKYPVYWKDYPKDGIARSELSYDTNKQCREAFIAGAEWQKSQMVPNEDVFKIWGTTEKEYLAKSMDKVHLEMEISTYLKDWEDDEEIGLHLSTDNGCIPIELEDVRDLARHFAQWGAEHLKK